MYIEGFRFGKGWSVGNFDYVQVNFLESFILEIKILLMDIGSLEVKGLVVIGVDDLKNFEEIVQKDEIVIEIFLGEIVLFFLIFDFEVLNYED